MPQLDGIETLHGLRQASPTLPVVLMSGYSEHERNERYGESGLAGFLQKPFTLDGLVGSLSGSRGKGREKIERSGGATAFPSPLAPRPYSDTSTFMLTVHL